ncbi:hypothetical protein ALO50_200088 [Pseudomonas syringae pv. cerasicola]|uniref:Uncharacterized protein n=2 Tax=Pseudomonas syringae group TaxID=136849 RepID=A0A0N8R3M5_PSESX|nr:hypothetical protein ALO50_200088 [Pseudomonas syringae pv. cerasicola]RMS89655.1 hypothetical protein ALP60_200074 [Pseudomonas savastanoi]SOS17496.1 hypothetical protein CFBP6109_02442 [Pseudomonas syringae pv. cerasicola]SOS17519.1 hypothetical protein CFBP6109_02454 [Pseudomonas syringae pv. cerasicola]
MKAFELMYRFNPVVERLDLCNSHVIDWKWHLQETRPHFWWRFRCWDGI